jgi:hypothetical protein
MRFIYNLSARAKLIWLLLAAKALALICVGLAVVVYEATTFPPRARRQLNNQAVVLAEVLQVPLRFNDSEICRRYLETSGTVPEITVAAVYAADGTLFESYSREGYTGKLPEYPGQAGSGVRLNEVAVWVPIQTQGRLLGHLYMSESLSPLYARVPQYFIMVGAVVCRLPKKSNRSADSLPITCSDETPRLSRPERPRAVFFLSHSEPF